MGGRQAVGWRRVDLWARVLQAILGEHRRKPFTALHGFWGNESGFLACLAGRVCEAPTVVSLCGGELVGFRDIHYGMQLSPAQRLLVRGSLRVADVITVGSQYMVQACREKAPWLEAAHLRRVPLGVDDNLFHPVRQRAGDSSLLAVGSLIPVKAHDLLLQAMCDVKRQCPRAILQIVGAGPRRSYLEHRIAEMNLLGDVTLVGPRPHDELPGIYSSADLLVLSSRHEAQAMVVLEAAACELPVVGTAVGSVVDLAPEAAVAVLDHKPGSLAERIIDLLSNPEKRADLGRRARRKATSEYRLERSVDQFVELYEHGRASEVV